MGTGEAEDSSDSPESAYWKTLSGGMTVPYVPPFASTVYVRDVTRAGVPVGTGSSGWESTSICAVPSTP